MKDKEVLTDSAGNEVALPEALKTRTPRSYDSIEKGALGLQLAERVELRNKLTISIDAELKEMEEKFAQAKKLVTGQQ